MANLFAVRLYTFRVSSSFLCVANTKKSRREILIEKCFFFFSRMHLDGREMCFSLAIYNNGFNSMFICIEARFICTFQHMFWLRIEIKMCYSVNVFIVTLNSKFRALHLNSNQWKCLFSNTHHMGDSHRRRRHQLHHRHKPCLRLLRIRCRHSPCHIQGIVRLVFFSQIEFILVHLVHFISYAH